MRRIPFSTVIIIVVTAMGLIVRDSGAVEPEVTATTEPRYEIACRDRDVRTLVCEDAAGKRVVRKPSRVSPNRFRRLDSGRLPSLFDEQAPSLRRCFELSPGRVVCD